jgi:hypothetical protein
MKSSSSVKQIERQVAAALQSQLSRISVIQLENMETTVDWRAHSLEAMHRPDIVAHVIADGAPVEIICEVKERGYPKQVRQAIAQLQAWRSVAAHDAVAMVGSTWLSPESRSICDEAGVGWIDLAGNCRIAFGGIHVERETTKRPKPAARSFRSIFSPKSAQVLRVLLKDPTRPWKVSDLAEASGVSLGQVSNVRSALIDREWAMADEEGLHLTNPEALLDAWRDEYEPVRGERSSWYTVMHGRELDQALRKLRAPADANGHSMLAGLSAAAWLAPYLRGTSTTSIYADEAAVPSIVERLKLRPAGSGANVEIIVPDDPALLNERVEQPNAPPVAPPVLTYLDLYQLHDRGREAANHLREKLLSWH